MYLVQTRECTSPIQCHPRCCSAQSTLPARLRAIGSVSCSSNRNARGADVMVFDETFGEAMRTQTNMFFLFHDFVTGVDTVCRREHRCREDNFLAESIE